MGAGRVSALVEERALAMASGEAGNTQIVMLGLRNRSRAATEWNNHTVKLKRSTSSSAISCASSCSRRCAPTRHLEISQPLKMSSCGDGRSQWVEIDNVAGAASMVLSYAGTKVRQLCIMQ
jgi:hypothetical protein